MQKYSIRDIHGGLAPLGSIEIAGWVRTHRQSKNVCFIELNDGTAVHGLQLVIEPGLPSYQSIAAKVGTGASISIKGQLVPSPAKGQKFECKVEELTLIGEADPETYPLQKKGHTLEFLREHLHLRPRSNTFGAVFRLRSVAAFLVHQFFQERGFYYVNSPIISVSDCEGAGEMFKVTTLDLAKIKSVGGKVDHTDDFFKREALLTVSGQMEAEIFATAISKVYTFGPTFRAENSNTTRHLAEFWMIEPEMAFCDLQGDMQVAQDFVKYVIAGLLDRCADELKFFSEREWVAKDHVQNLERVAASTFEHMDYTEAIKILEKCGKKFDFPVKWGMDMQAEHERYLTDEHVKGPVIVVNYPKEIKAFYMRVNDDQKTVRAMDVLVPRLGEIVGGSQREERHDVLLARIREMKLPEENYWWYLELRKFGTVPHAGFGLGFERLLMYVTGMQNIRDVIPVPRHPGMARF